MKRYRKIELNDKILYVDFEDLSFRQKYFGAIICEKDLYTGYCYYREKNIGEKDLFLDCSIGLSAASITNWLPEEIGMSNFVIFTMFITLAIIVYSFFKGHIIYRTVLRKMNFNELYKVKFHVKERENNIKKKYSHFTKIIWGYLFLIIIGICFWFSGNISWLATTVIIFIYYFCNITQVSVNKDHVEYIIEQ